MHDVTAPTISTLPAASTINCPATPSFATPTAADNCDGSPSLTFSDATTAGSCAGNYSITRTWTARDACGNTSTASQTINVHDVTAPTISALPAPSTIDCPATPSFATPTASDDCDGHPSLTSNDVRTQGNCAGNYSITRTWTARDACGNISTASQTINVHDVTPPSISALPAPSTIDCPAAPSFATPTAADNCDGSPSLTFSDATTAGSCAGNYSVTRTWTAVDACGNRSTASQRINVHDVTPPTISALPAESTINCPATPSFATPTATDACDPNPSLTFNDVRTAGSCAGNYSITRTWTARDACGNISTASQKINVHDVTPPVITCPASIIVNNTPGQCGANVSFVATATDACGMGGITYSKAPGSFFAVGTTVVTATATDACGNSSQCNFNVTVNDNEKPVITVQNLFRCFADDNNGCSINLGATATDNCMVISLTSNAPACFAVGTTTVTWTATDNHGNVSTKTQTVTRNPEINIDICAGPTRTIYTGTYQGVGPFGPQSVNLTSTVSGGTPGYTYKWTPAAGLNNALIANPVASPTVTTIYTLMVTDSKGCTRSLSITINVLPLSAASCGGSGNNVKFNVCHIPPGSPSNPQNICISVNALPAHLTSGSNGHNNCYLGLCDQRCFSTSGSQSVTQPITSRSSGTEDAVAIEKEQIAEAFDVNVYPNPSTSDFSILVSGKSNEPVVVRIIDMNGVVRSTSTVVTKSAIKVGTNLRGGTYMAEVIQGANRRMVKLVKLN